MKGSIQFFFTVNVSLSERPDTQMSSRNSYRWTFTVQKSRRTRILWSHDLDNWESPQTEHFFSLLWSSLMKYFSSFSISQIRISIYTFSSFILQTCMILALYIVNTMKTHVFPKIPILIEFFHLFDLLFLCRHSMQFVRGWAEKSVFFVVYCSEDVGKKRSEFYYTAGSGGPFVSLFVQIVFLKLWNLVLAPAGDIIFSFKEAYVIW